MTSISLYHYFSRRFRLDLMTFYQSFHEFGLYCKSFSTKTQFSTATSIFTLLTCQIAPPFCHLHFLKTTKTFSDRFVSLLPSFLLVFWRKIIHKNISPLLFFVCLESLSILATFVWEIHFRISNLGTFWNFISFS